MDSDQTYFDGLRHVQPAAFEKLAEQYEGRLYRFFFCDHRNHHVAEEQTAETFAQLVHSLPNMRCGSEKLAAFVFSVARHVRARRWRAPRLTNLLPEDAHEAQDSHPAPHRQMEARDELEKVLTAINRLERNTRDVFLLRFVEEYPIKDVAEALDLPVGTVKSHIHRGRLQLKKQLLDSELPT